ncbi:hypothetical protein [Pleionea sp. CnH1-48]|uniref:hypothetical protein n=1 Tax=Pleionea sp. CnH1-48 TaxID=2954494 RepID=UPI002096CF55|nr:hypothetical protein [Pleionea sp. CnH1-48]MCO7226905.1 hypothetical protein [Pleionea sp. CnH1-48]
MHTDFKVGSTGKTQEVEQITPNTPLTNVSKSSSSSEHLQNIVELDHEVSSPPELTKSKTVLMIETITTESIKDGVLATKDSVKGSTLKTFNDLVPTLLECSVSRQEPFSSKEVATIINMIEQGVSAELIGQSLESLAQISDSAIQDTKNYGPKIGGSINDLTLDFLDIAASRGEAIKSTDESYIKNAVRQHIPTNVMAFSLGVGDYNHEMKQLVGTHQEFLNPHKMANFVTGSTQNGKMEMLLATNSAKTEQLHSGDSLVYFGGDSDILHPLIATGATEINIVSCSNGEDAEHGPRLDYRNSMEASIVEKLEAYIADGYEVNVERDDENHLSTITVTATEENDDPVLTIKFHSASYDQFIDESDDTFDYFMEKDSWLKEWKDSDDKAVPPVVNSLLNEDGHWIGGFDSNKLGVEDALSGSFTDRTEQYVDSQHIKWSGYENLHIRQKGVEEVAELDDELVEAAPSYSDDPYWQEAGESIVSCANILFDNVFGSFTGDHYASLIEDTGPLSNLGYVGLENKAKTIELTAMYLQEKMSDLGYDKALNTIENDITPAINKYWG